jgi:hypothetical protein
MIAKLVFAVGLVLATAAQAGNTALVAPVHTEVTDAVCEPQVVEPVRDPTFFDYTVAWAIQLDHIAVVGLTPVQDTLLWVSSGGRTSSAEQNWMLIYDLRSKALIDSFPQAVTTTWGWRDMCYDPAEDVVYAGTDGNRLDKIDPNSHQVIQTYTVTGSGTPSVVRALAFDGVDSLFSANFTSAPVSKFSTTGTNCHQVAPVPPLAIYGLAVDESRDRVYGTTGDYSRRILEYQYSTWTVLDSTVISEVTLFGGCEMLGDRYLLVIDQGAHDSVICLDLGGGGAAKDVGVQSILAPTGSMPPGNVTPRVRIKNFGTDPQSDIPVYISIDSAGTPVYTSDLVHAGPLDPGATADVTFTPDWDATAGTYNVTSWTMLADDEDPSNDTAMGGVQVIAMTWETIASPTTVQDKIVHATIWDPGTDMVYQVGGCPAGSPGTYDGICRAYDPEGDSWTTKAVMPTPLGWVGYGIVADKIYILGGHNNSGAMVGTTMEYDIAANSWSSKTPRPAGLGAPLSATWRDTLIYVMGGMNGSAGTNQVDIYDPANDAWASGTNLPAIADMGSAVIISDTIYIAQALNRGTSQCWRNLYKGAIDPANPTSINWIQGPVLSEPVFDGATVAVAGDVYWLGGYINATTVTNKIWKYSPATGMVTSFTPNYPITVSRCTFAAARDASWGWEIYGMAGDSGGNWSAPNRKYVKLAFPISGVDEGTRPRQVTASMVSVRPSVGRGLARISYSVAKAGRVNLDVYDASGSLVRTLVDGVVVEPGTQTVVWDRADGMGRRVSKGTYFYRLSVDGQTLSSKSVVLD